MLRTKPFRGQSFDMLSLRVVIPHFRIEGIYVHLSSALHGRCNLSSNRRDSLRYFISDLLLVRADRSLHECFVWEDVVSSTRCEVTYSENKVFTTADIARFDRVERLIDCVCSTDWVSKLVGS